VTPGGAEASAPTIDYSVLDNIRALQREGTPDLVGRLITLYVAEAASILNGLHHAFQEGNTQEIFKLAHKLKSSSANVGALRLSALLKDLELRGRQNEIEVAAPLFVRVQEEFVAVQEALKPAAGQVNA
jgi:HPt (histidine-containing phosphotransfer) domain-containing protein